MKKYLLTFVLLLDSILLFSQNLKSFNIISGDATSNQFAKSINVNSGYFIIGSRIDKATLSKISINGIVEYSVEVNVSSVFTDILELQNGNLMVIGYTKYGDNSTCRTLIGVFGVNAKNFISLKEYDFAQGRRDLPVSIYYNPKPANSIFPYYVAGVEVYSGTITDKAYILTLDENGIIGEKITYDSEFNDYEFIRNIVPAGTNGDMLICGGIVKLSLGEVLGTIVIIDNKCTPLNAKNFNSPVHFFASIDFEDQNGGKSHLLGGIAPTTIGGALLVKTTNNNKNYGYRIPQLTIISEISNAENPNEFYALGSGNFGGVNKSVILKLKDNGNSLSILNSKVLANNETEYSKGFTQYIGNNKLMYCDGRKNLSKGFGDFDGFISIEDLDSIGCLTQNINLSLILFNDTDEPFKLQIESRTTPKNANNISSSIITYKSDYLCCPDDKLQSILNFVICPDENVNVNNVIYEIQGQFIQNLKSSNGCDSTIVINIDFVIDSNVISNIDSFAINCNTFNTLFINGIPAQPLDGIYTWQISINGGSFDTAPGINDQEDYTLQSPNPGQYKFRRIYYNKLKMCSDTSNIVNSTIPQFVNAGIDRAFECVDFSSLNFNLIGVGSGIWTQSSANQGSVNLVQVNDSIAEVNSIGNSGNYYFIFSNTFCQDTVQVTITEKAYAGIDFTIDCYESASITLQAEGNGYWSISPLSDINVDILNPNNSNSVVNNFSNEGLLQLIWNDNNCFDTINIEVDDICPCIIKSNELDNLIPKIYCNYSGQVKMIGSDPKPSGGTFLWLYSLNEGDYNAASLSNDAKDYVTENLAVGKHSFKRIYFSPIDGCIDTSLAISILVIKDTLESVSFALLPEKACEGDTIFLYATTGLPNAIYNWASNKGGLGSSHSSSNFIVPTTPGEFIVTLTQSAHICDDFKTSPSTVKSGLIMHSPVIDLGNDTTYCLIDNERIISAGNHQSYIWSDGTAQHYITITKPGAYSVTVENENGCTKNSEIKIKEFCCDFFYPNIIYPSSTINNEFHIEGKYNCVIKSILFIYDRWGNLLKKDQSNMASWNGTSNGKLVEQGVYIFLFNYTAIDENGQPFEDQILGNITVLR